MRDMRRRQFIALVGGGAASIPFAVLWPLGARAQPRRKLPTIGVLGTSTPSAWTPWLTPFQQRLRELGWIEGRTIAIEYRWAESRNERGAEIAAEFARLKVDVIVTTGASVPAVRETIAKVPVVFATWSDPMGSGYIASLARPGGNATGLSVQSLDTATRGRAGLATRGSPGPSRQSQQRGRGAGSRNCCPHPRRRCHDIEYQARGGHRASDRGAQGSCPRPSRGRRPGPVRQ